MGHYPTDHRTSDPHTQAPRHAEIHKLQSLEPHNEMAEACVLGAILTDNTVLDRLTGLLQPTDFYVGLHAELYAAMVETIADRRRADLVTLVPLIRGKKVGDADAESYLAALPEYAPSTPVALMDYVREVLRFSAQRGVLAAARQLGQDTARPAVKLLEAYERATKDCERALSRMQHPDQHDIRYAADETIGASGGAYLIKGLIPRGSCGLLYGSSTAGKTFLALDAAFCVALGKPFMGRPTQQAAVLYIPLEGRSTFGRRVIAARARHGDPGHMFARLNTSVVLGNNALSATSVSHIIDAAKRVAEKSGHAVGLIVIDTLACALAGDNENEASTISAVMAQQGRITAETGATVLFVHHPGKDRERGPRGSSALYGAPDTIIAVEREQKAAVRSVILEKAKDGVEGPVGAFSLENVVLGQDEDGDPITSCVLKVSDEAVKKARQRPPDNTPAGKALYELELLASDGKGQTARGHGRAPDGVLLIKRSDWRAACLAKRLSADGLPEAEKKAFQRAYNTLSRENFIGEFGDLVWLIKKTP